ncbi:MAG TPA: choice-of-anchor Q domain-containing protein [Dehalococcoidia bacterium]|nr:choice-of-anchor Q domain-containing protein [Dehalococcoidia bacterium]
MKTLHLDSADLHIWRLAATCTLLLLAMGGALLQAGPVSAAMITVTAASDGPLNGTNGLCSLREAITNANANSATQPDCDAGTGEDTIVFAAGVTLITITGDLPSISDPAGLTIDGAGLVTINGDGMFLPFITNTGAGLTLDGLTVTNGGESAIINNGDLILQNAEITNSNATFSSGAIQNNPDATATINNSLVMGNSAIAENGGGIFNFGTMTLNNTTVSNNNANQHGGGIFNTGTLQLNNSTVSFNGAGQRGGGIWNEDELTLNNTDVNGNTAANYGGGIFAEAPGTVTITNGSSLSSNLASVNGGGILSESVLVVQNSSVNGNTAANYGGGINAGGPVTITNSTIIGNTAVTGGGGGIQAQISSLTIANSTLTGNSAGTDGGAIRNVSLNATTISGSTLSGNNAGAQGGAIYSDEPGSTVSIVSSTLSGNTANSGGAIRANFSGLSLGNSTVTGNTAVFGGGIYNGEESSTGLINVTITDNTATTSGGGVYSPADAPGDVVMRNTIIADQQAGADCSGSTFISMGHNLDSDNTCNLNQGSDIPTGNANLGPLANNGGATQTHALLLSSDAIDAGNDAVCAADPIFNVDQRGAPRPQGPQCDIGAFEAAAPTPTPSATPEPTDTPTPTAFVTTTPTLSPTSTPTSSGPTPVERELVWADVNCSDVADPVDALITLRFDAGLSVNIGDCPPMGTAIEVLGSGVAGLGEGDGDPQTWGDADCDESIGPVDALKLLRYDAALSVSQQQGCPPIGSEVTIQHAP